MKVIILYVLSILILSSCISETEQDVSEKNTGIDSTLVTGGETIYAWQGNLDGRIPVLMWYRQVDNVIFGSLFYTHIKDPQPITLIGTVTEKECLINEYLPDGQVSGIWSFTTSTDAAEGIWSSPVNNKRFNISMMHIDTPVTINEINNVTDIAGTYRYSMSEEGSDGNLTVERISENEISINFENVSGGPAHNMALLTDTLLLQNHTVLYNFTKYGDCSFRINFYSGFAIVEYVDGNSSCGFGHKAHVNGIYMKL